MTPAADGGTALRRAVWRYEHGSLSETRVRRLLEWHYARAAADFESLAAAMAAVHRHAPALAGEYDAFRGGAGAALRLQRWREALDQILRGHGVLAAIRAVAEADAELSAAAAGVERLNERVASCFLRALPCTEVPARLLRLARERMETGRYLQAAYLAGVCRRQAEPLVRAEPCTVTQARELTERLERMRVACADTRELVEGEDPAGEAVFEAARALVRDGYPALAARVADELEAALAARLQLHHELRRPGEGDAAPTLAALRPRLAESGDGVWARATGLLWASRLAGGIRRMQSQRDRLKRLSGRLADGPAVASPPGAAPPRSADRPET
ncbi:MAG TPA: hypothetical protein VGO40_10555 [Longimicrobium sp.]|jgi:hypothetical protein|nr:hypothetical protein [Longimicrobium sp.]